ncbi:MAG TPA: lanthionine synthetase LanC family protein [Blastocatellia bacterium]|nr:lanthionine synthetase LanC family protein [Blastocatellia bacterium]
MIKHKRVTGVFLLVVLSASSGFQSRPSQRPYLQAAKEAAQWIRSVSVRTDQGVAWPADPRDPKTVEHDLYSGTPGVILFLIEMYASTGDKAFLEDARAGANHLLSALSREEGTGLYVGIAGIGFTLQETYKATGEEKYRTGVLQCLKLLRERAVKKGRGVEWSDTTDIISGAAGTGLFLLYAARELKDSSARELATLCGRRLIELEKQDTGGIKWAMDSKFPRLMPNFSHGTAGVAYFLATLYSETRDEEFLRAAVGGAKYLQSIANTEGDTCTIFHDEPDGKNLYYLSWCHGPAGTARLFYRLFQVTGDPTWMNWVKKAARSILNSGIPEKQTPGFWNNVGQCCGSAGVAEFVLSLYQITRDREYLDFAVRVTANLLARATRDANGLKWIQAEHRIKPELLVAQTGHMQGAAGIGAWLLHLEDFQRGKKPLISWPDSPF